NRPTDCAPWTVADIVRHLVGAAKGNASLREEFRQLFHGARHAREHDGSVLDATNNLQVSEHGHLSGPELIGELDRIWSDAVRRRMARSAVVRMVSVPNDSTGSTPSGTGARIKLGHLFDVILTRDVWLHRIDIARAIGRPVTLGPHDRRVIEDVIAEWAERLGTGFDLTIDRPFIARYRAGRGGEHLVFDAIEICRVLSGRASHPSPLFDTKVLF
ncbi:MAG: maleylpyruvate isomerase N-terminal domain-containing protein, partial [Acidimicrobiia bacterium]